MSGEGENLPLNLPAPVATWVRVFWFTWICAWTCVQSPIQAALIREANTTLRMPAQPPPLSYSTVNAFPGLSFPGVVGMATPPGETNRLFVIQRGGQIVVLTNLAAPSKTTFLDLSSRRVDSGGENGVLGLAFHPGYRTNGLFFVFYSFTRNGSLSQRVSRFSVDPTNPHRALLDSERPLITQADDASNHNGGDIHFGRDGYLYVSVGDEGNGNDSLNNSQRIDKDFFSGLLRLDVDGRPGNLVPNAHPALTDTNRLEYRVPADNPWVGATQFVGKAVDPTKVRTEFFAVGLRNPWRMSFDPLTGLLYVGDVGQDRFEEVNIMTSGGNYGWAFREGKVAGPKPNSVPANTPRIDPIWDYAHGSGGTNVGNSITGGVVYRGFRFPQLYGFYVFGDYVSGNIWAFRYNGSKVSDFQRLTTDSEISGFRRDPRNGDVLMADLGAGSIKRLEGSNVTSAQPLPLTLAATGAFSDLQTLDPQPGIVPYEVNVPFWSDGAAKQRWFSIPPTSALATFSVSNAWSFPTGTVWIKHFELVTNEVTQERRRIETRFLVRNAEGVYGVTYRWTSDSTNAQLVAAEGFQEDVRVELAEGLVRTQRWIYPSRTECLTCHNPGTGGPLGFDTVQLHREVDYGDGLKTNQIAALHAAGYIGGDLPALQDLPYLVGAGDTNASLEFRVRSYLHANCVACHRPGGTAPGFWDARFHTPTDLAGLIEGRLNSSGNNPSNRVILPGHPDLSMLLSRISRRGAGTGAMPPLGSSRVDDGAVQLLRDWIGSDELQFRASYNSWAALHFNDYTGLAAEPDYDFDQDGDVNRVEFENGTDPWDTADSFRFGGVRGEEGVLVLRLIQPANRRVKIETTTSLLSGSEWRSVDGVKVDPYFPWASREIEVRIPAGREDFRYFRARVSTP